MFSIKNSYVSKPYFPFQAKLAAEIKAENEKRIRQLQAQIESAECANKASLTQYQEMEKRQAKLNSDLKEKEAQNGELLREQKIKLQEIQTLSSSDRILKDQVSSKVIQL